jgi:hypothetical protein
MKNLAIYLAAGASALFMTACVYRQLKRSGDEVRPG